MALVPAAQLATSSIALQRIGAGHTKLYRLQPQSLEVISLWVIRRSPMTVMCQCLAPLVNPTRVSSTSVQSPYGRM